MLETKGTLNVMGQNSIHWFNSFNQPESSLLALSLSVHEVSMLNQDQSSSSPRSPSYP